MPVAQGIAADVVVGALRAMGATHVVTVPDTNQRTVLELLDGDPGLPVLRAATEDDVLGLCAGLWLAGAMPVAAIQQLGLFASANALRGITHDMGIPLAILAGLYGRELDRAPDDSSASAVRLCVPLLEALELPWTLVEGPETESEIARGLAAAFEQRCTSVVLLGAPTA